MPAIIEMGTSQLGRAAAGAAQVLAQYQERQDRLNAEAQDRAYADKQFEFRKTQADRSYELQRESSNRAQQQLDRAIGQDGADADFFRGLAVEHGASPEEVAGMSVDGARQAANVLMHRSQLMKRAQSVGQFAGDVFAMLGIAPPAPQGQDAMPGQGMGVMTQGGDPAQGAAPADPFGAMIASMMENATTEQDFDQIENMLTKAVQTSHNARIEAEQRAQAAPMYEGLVARYGAVLNNEDASELATAYSLWQMGRWDDTKLTEAIHLAAKRADTYKRGSTERLDPYTDARLRAITGDSTLTAEEKDQRIRSLQGGGSVAAPTQSAEPARTTTTYSYRQMRKKMGDDAARQLLSSLEGVPEQDREAFALRRLSAVGLEKGLSEDEILDLVESALKLID